MEATAAQLFDPSAYVTAVLVDQEGTKDPSSKTSYDDAAEGADYGEEGAPSGDAAGTASEEGY